MPLVAPHLKNSFSPIGSDKENIEGATRVCDIALSPVQPILLAEKPRRRSGANHRLPLVLCHTEILSAEI